MTATEAREGAATGGGQRWGSSIEGHIGGEAEATTYLVLTTSCRW